jgi:hypothetical protein
MSKCASRETGRPSKLNNTANAGRIVRSRNGRKILPAFLLTVFVAALAIAAIPQEKKKAPKLLRRRSGRSFVKAVGTIRQENRQGRGKLPPCMPQSECGADHTGYRAFLIRHRTDHRTPAEPSAAEFSGMVSATALSEQGIFAPCGSVLTCTSKERQTHRQAAKSTQYQGFPPAAV